MFYFFISSKIILTIAASYLIAQASPWLVLAFALFIFIDVADSKIMGLGYRPYDSFFDRTFAYVCFFTFLFYSPAVFPAIIYIAAFVVRDFFVAGSIQEVKKYSVRSNILDRMTMLIVAIFFSLQAGGIFTESNIGIAIICFILAGLILYQGMDKIKRIKGLAKEIT
jgi:hypothetical protein